MLAVMNALKEWRPYLLSARHKFEIWTDHRNLTYFRQPQYLNRRQARWHTELQPYNFTMIHKPGSSMKKTDILSRCEEHKAGKDDNKDIVLLEAKHLARPITITPLPDDIVARIRAEARNQDGSVTKALTERMDGWQKEDDLVTFEGHIYVPKNKELRDDLIR